ncbi:MAG: ABC transporter permease [Armatimonadota bacterium]|nr:ABC transporter permease [Armatimonadota bacterium]MCX7776664.1 ABC transporter permease [Armatimonadota bacterium]MDW8025721.1 ABC transporter permease [Armatimonadota bacterium]
MSTSIVEPTARSRMGLRHRLKALIRHIGSWFYIIWLIAWREVKAFFTSWIAYAMLIFFLVLCGYIFFAIFMVGRTSDMRYFFWDVAIILMFIVPTMTMRLFAEERRLGTLELLLTSPVSDWQVVLGKFMGSFIVLCITLSLTLYVPVIVKRIANPDLGPYWSAYIGLLFYGAAMLAIGAFWSATTDNQIIAAIATFGTLLMLYIISWPAEGVGGWSELFQRISLYHRYKDFADGLVDTKHIVFYVMLTLLALYFAVRTIESRLWR